MASVVEDNKREYKIKTMNEHEAYIKNVYEVIAQIIVL